MPPLRVSPGSRPGRRGSESGARCSPLHAPAPVRVGTAVRGGPPLPGPLVPALAWIVRLPLLGERELGQLLGVDEEEAVAARRALTRLGWVEWVVPASDQAQPRRRALLRAAAVPALAALLGRPPRGAPAPLRAQQAGPLLADRGDGGGRGGECAPGRARRAFRRARPSGARARPPPAARARGRPSAGSRRARRPTPACAWSRPERPSSWRGTGPGRPRRTGGCCWRAGPSSGRALASGAGEARRPFSSPPRARTSSGSGARRPGRVPRPRGWRPRSLLTTVAELEVSGASGAIWRTPDARDPAPLAERLYWQRPGTLPAGIEPPAWPRDPAAPPRLRAREAPLRRRAVWARDRGMPIETHVERNALLTLATGAVEKGVAELVGRHPLLDREQLATLVDLPDYLALRCIERLRMLGVIAHAGREEAGDPGSSPRFRLTARGLRWLAARDRVPLGRYVKYGSHFGLSGSGRGPAIRRPGSPLWDVEHTVGVNRLFVGFALEARAAGARLAAWRTEVEATRRWVLPDGRDAWVRPDRRGRAGERARCLLLPDRVRARNGQQAGLPGGSSRATATTSRRRNGAPTSRASRRCSSPAGSMASSRGGRAGLRR